MDNNSLTHTKWEYKYHIDESPYPCYIYSIIKVYFNSAGSRKVDTWQKVHL